VALVVPSIIAVYGIILLHGRQGYVSQLWHWLGGQPHSYIYGLIGILLAHVFFNLPLATRILLQRLEAIQPETWRLSSQLGMTSKDLWRHIEWPYLKGVLPQLAAMIFALCFTSFAIVMTLGGGPKATTIEVAIFQAIRFDFDIAKAVYLSLLQIAFCGFILACLLAEDIDNLPTDEVTPTDRKIIGDYLWSSLRYHFDGLAKIKSMDVVRKILAD
jgi:thiamine transport system permease protein